MKKNLVKIILSVLLVIIIVGTILSLVLVNKEKKLFDETSNKSAIITSEKDKINEENEKTKKEIEDLKVELKDKLEEEEIWNKAIEKLNQA